MKLPGVLQYVNVRRENGDQQGDQVPAGQTPQSGDQQTDAAGNFACAADRHQQFGRGQVRWHDFKVAFWVQEMECPRHDKKNRCQPA